MAIPFGFSAGDFIAGLQLLNKAVTVLRDTEGASSHYQYTIIELENVVSVLRRVQGLQATDSTSELSKKLHFLGHTCNVPLQRFLNKLRKMEAELKTTHNGIASSSTHNRFQRYGKQPFRRIQWGIQLKNHVSDLKTAIGPQLELIDIVLQLISL
ncbi:hypothetical protein N0V90_013523 [Kalmusia sp. IMI 367209]|nr:hypothetical protein N0V90_013523 [Kalmusia sp. IMI 367209]